MIILKNGTKEDLNFEFYPAGNKMVLVIVDKDSNPAYGYAKYGISPGEQLLVNSVVPAHVYCTECENFDIKRGRPWCGSKDNCDISKYGNNKKSSLTTHVYCTECINFNINYGISKCRNEYHCDISNCEDSKELSQRPFFTPK